MQMLEGHLAETLRENIGLLRHVQKKRGALRAPLKPRNSKEEDRSYVGEDGVACRPKLSRGFERVP